MGQSCLSTVAGKNGRTRRFYYLYALRSVIGRISKRWLIATIFPIAHFIPRSLSSVPLFTATVRSDSDGWRNIAVKTVLHFGALVGTSEKFLGAIRVIPPLAESDLTILISGQTGTGKELFSRAIHYQSRRQRHPFIPVNCAALPDHLFENELFGHIKGAYTDASSAEQGLIAEAEGGTLVLDEVDALSLVAQAKLLASSKIGSIGRWARRGSLKADLRVIASTNADLLQRVEAGQFRGGSLLSAQLSFAGAAVLARAHGRCRAADGAYSRSLRQGKWPSRRGARAVGHGKTDGLFLAGKCSRAREYHDAGVDVFAAPSLRPQIFSCRRLRQASRRERGRCARRRLRPWKLSNGAISRLCSFNIKATSPTPPERPVRNGERSSGCCASIV